MKRRIVVLLAIAGLVGALATLVVGGAIGGAIASGTNNAETTITVDDATAELSSTVCSADAAPTPVDTVTPCTASLVDADSKGAGDRMGDCLSCHADIWAD